MPKMTGKDHDNQLSPDDGPPVDDMEHTDEYSGDGEGDSGPAPDAGSNTKEAEAAHGAEAKFKLAVVERESDADESIRIARATEPNLVKRARAIKALQGFQWPVTEQKTAGGMTLLKATSCDGNRVHALSVIFGEDTENGRPHIDTFRGRFVDHVGHLVDDRYSMVPLINAMNAAGLEAQPIIGVRNAFKEWAMQVKVNDLILQFEKRIPEWDGVERIETRLMDLFQTFDTKLNREFGIYFWLSVYNRIMNPGCLAPIVLSLFGAQNAGKSRFSNEICRVVMNDKNASSVQLDLSSNSLEFLREITGNSVVANIGEMTGFTRGDLNKIKDFVTRTSDKMHYKYEGHFEQLRQWVSVLDGNKYEGLQRDDTGNRRFYPMFLGQLPDKDGQPAWAEDFEVDYTDFEALFMQCMAECRAWMASKGMKAYDAYVRATAKRVFEFSISEMKGDRGTIRDDNMDVFLKPALKICNGIALERTKNKGWFIYTYEIVNKIGVISRNRCDVKMNHLPNKMAVLGGESVMINNQKGYIFRTCPDKPDFLKLLGGSDSDDDAPIRPDKVYDSSSDDGNGGF